VIRRRVYFLGFSITASIIAWVLRRRGYYTDIQTRESVVYEHPYYIVHGIKEVESNGHRSNERLSTWKVSLRETSDLP
jgi:hypothetical protein